MSDDEFQAVEVRNLLDRMQSEEFTHTESVNKTVEAFARRVVEDGTFWPDCNVTAELSLSPRERITGKRTQDMTAMLGIGLVLGAALERDIPAGGEFEEAWRDGEFELPEKASDTEDHAAN